MKVNAKELRSQIRGLLLNYPKCKDSDEYLCATLWGFEVMRYYGTHDIETVSSKELLYLLMAGRLTHPESVMRTRRKLQEEHPDLRGKSYIERHKNVKKVKKDLGYKQN